MAETEKMTSGRALGRCHATSSRHPLLLCLPRPHFVPKARNGLTSDAPHVPVWAAGEWPKAA